MKLFKNCLFLSALAFYPLSAQAAASSSTEEVQSQGWYLQALTPIEPSHQELVNQARTNSEARKELLQRIQSGTVDTQALKKWDLTPLFLGIDLTTMSDEEMHVIVRVMNPLPQGYRDIVEAKAAEGSAFAQATLGYLFSAEEKHKDAASWWRLAAAQGNASALANLAHNIYIRNIEKLPEENAKEMLNNAASLGSGFASFLLYYHNNVKLEAYRDFETMSLDVIEHRENLVRAAHLRYARAERDLGLIFTCKEGYHEEAIVFLERAIAQGYNNEKILKQLAFAEKSKGWAFSRQEKVEEAIYWYQRSADHGNIEARYFLAKKQEMAHDYESARKNFKIYLEQEEFSSSIKRLKNINGLGINKSDPYDLAHMKKPDDLTDVAITLLQDAKTGDALAQYTLGLFHMSGLLPNSDPGIAYEYLTLAKNQGHQQAQFALGKLHLRFYKLKDAKAIGEKLIVDSCLTPTIIPSENPEAPVTITPIDFEATRLLEEKKFSEHAAMIPNYLRGALALYPHFNWTQDMKSWLMANTSLEIDKPKKLEGVKATQADLDDYYKGCNVGFALDTAYMASYFIDGVFVPRNIEAARIFAEQALFLGGDAKD